MIFPEVKKLYKYMAFNANTMSCLVNGEFWFAKPETFNDPLDCGLLLFSQMSIEALIKVLEGASSVAEKQNRSDYVEQFNSIISEAKENNVAPAKLHNEITEIFINSLADKIQKIGILSLSEVNDNILMWSHYAEQHKGLCVEFLRESGNDLAINEKTLPVRYSVKKPIISVGEHILASSTQKKEIRRSLVYTKSSDWAYEREWRMVADNGNTAKKVNARISNIIFGFKMKPEQRSTIINIFKGDKTIKFKEVVLKDDDFGVAIVDYDHQFIMKESHKKIASTKSTSTPSTSAPRKSAAKPTSKQATVTVSKNLRRSAPKSES